ncbi:VOC family protein [Leucobacter sp. wl10]|uniref:VOC family protein n=1 Tax=Leucobacter sp. wl10 TaxID=2304677 RepID=UPI000E5BC0F7|nr:VOC family protein [Leucobacter sp. wl10]RGE19092.1 glyoxalase [Leucobacter sp. wl10]
MITGAKKVRVGVADQNQAKAFWVDKLGAEIAQDEAYGDDSRWLKVRLPDGVVILLESRRDDAPDAPDGQPNTPVFLACDDLDTTYRDLSSRGVEFVQEPVDLPFGRWALFTDGQGNRFALQPVSDQK